MKTICSAATTLNKSELFSRSVAIYFIGIPEQLAIIFLKNINRLVFGTEMKCILCGRKLLFKDLLYEIRPATKSIEDSHGWQNRY